MNIEYHRWWSQSLRQDMELKVYGYAGKPGIVFPAMGGRFFEYEDFGMVEAVHAFIDEGKLQLYTVDSVDNQSWANTNAPPAERAVRHNEYDRYIIEEVAPFIRQHNPYPGKFLATGCSMGGFHSANLFFRHPDVIDAMIAISGVFRLNMFIGDYMDENVYLNTPLAYLADLKDPWYLDLYRHGQIIVGVGQGAWEGPMVEDARALDGILSAKDIPHWVDIWGFDVNHDWPWWRKMAPYFLQSVLGGEKKGWM